MVKVIKNKYIGFGFDLTDKMFDLIKNDNELVKRYKETSERKVENAISKLIPTHVRNIADVSGAGDTFLAGLVKSYIESKNINTAIKFAQQCTTIVIQKSGVSTV